MRITRRLAPSAALALAATSLALLPGPGAAVPQATAARADGVRVTDGCLKSVPEPGSKQKVKICYTLFKPARASRHHKVPFIMHSHGWGGSRTKDPAAFAQWLDAGYGVLSFDQRGFGESGGYAHVENPRYEGRDNLKLIRKVARLRWVKKDAPGDPRVGAIGGSYGGGYQFLGAFMELKRKGKPVYDALAPEITWYDLKQSLAPLEVPRTTWATILGAGAAQSDALEPQVYEALTEAAATNTWPDGSGPSGVNLDAYFRRNGPKWHVDHGRRLNIPVLLGQGTTDSLFELRQGFANWKHALTRRARRHSIFVGYNGGHVLPKTVPPGAVPGNSDPCSQRLAGGDFSHLALKFMNAKLKHRHNRLRGYGRYHLATTGGTCTTVRSIGADTTYDVGTVATTAAGGAWTATKVTDGPVRIAGTPYLTGDLTTVGVDNRAFYGLAIGTSVADARLVQNNTLPLSEPDLVTGQQQRIRLPAVAVNVPEGQSLFVIASPVDDIFLGTGSRTPGAIVLDNTVAHLPVVGR